MTITNATPSREDDNSFVPEAPFTLGKQVHPNFTLLYKDKGDPADVIDPFAIVFSVEKVTPRPGYYMAPPPMVKDYQSECLKNARIGMIKHSILPSLFYVTEFASAEEAVEQVEYFFSLSETQQLSHLRYDSFARRDQHLEQDVNLALMGYREAVQNIPKPTGTLLEYVAQHIEPAQTLLKTLALNIAPFAPTCSAFKNECSQGTIILYEHVMALRIAIRDLTSAVDEPLSSNSVLIAYGGLLHAVSCLGEVLHRSTQSVPTRELNAFGTIPTRPQW